MLTSSEINPLTELAEGRVSHKMFHDFLMMYSYYWHNCHAKGRINAGDLYDAEQNAIKYAKTRSLHLEFNGMDFKIRAVMEPTDAAPAGTECSCYAPTYLELSLIIEQAIGFVSTMWPKEPEDVPGIADWLKRTKRFRDGSQRVNNAKRKLHEIYDHSLIEVNREKDINELLWCYKHLFYFVQEEEYDAERNETRFRIEVDLGHILPPFNEHGMTEDEVIEYSHKILERMINLNMLTEGETDDCGEMTLWINEPETWS